MTSLQEFLSSRPAHRNSVELGKCRLIVADAVAANKQGPNHRPTLANNVSPENAARLLERW